MLHDVRTDYAIENFVLKGQVVGFGLDILNVVEMVFACVSFVSFQTVMFWIMLAHVNANYRFVVSGKYGYSSARSAA